MTTDLFSRQPDLLAIEWNSIRLGDPAHGIVAKNVQKTPLVGGGIKRSLGGGV